MGTGAEQVRRAVGSVCRDSFPAARLFSRFEQETRFGIVEKGEKGATRVAAIQHGAVYLPKRGCRGDRDPRKEIDRPSLSADKAQDFPANY